MKAYIHVSNDFSVEVEVKAHPEYTSEIIIGGQRLTLYGARRKDISTISIFPGVKTWARASTNDNTTLIGTIGKTNLGMILMLLAE